MGFTRFYFGNSQLTNIKLILLLIFVPCILTNTILAQINDTVYIQKYDNNKILNITNKGWVLEDPNRSLAICDIINDPNFKMNNDNAINFKPSKSSYWVKLVIKNSTSVQVKRYIAFTSIDIYELQFYSFDSSINLKNEYIVGNKLSFGDRPIETHEFTFPIILKPNEVNTIYIYLDHHFQSLTTSIRLFSDKSLIKERTSTSFKSGLMIGGILIFLLISVSLFVFFKQAIHFNYLVYLLGATIFFLSFNEGNRYVWNHWNYFQDPSQYIGPTLLLTGFIGVFRLFFRIKNFNIYLSLIYKSSQLTGILLIIGFLCWKYIGGFYNTLYRVMGIFYLLNFLSFIIIGIWVYTKDKRQEYLWFLASMILLLLSSLLIIFIEQTSILDRNTFGFVFNNLPMITLYYEASILSFFLIRRVYNEKLTLQQKVIEDREKMMENLHDLVISGLGGIRLSISSFITTQEISFKPKLENIRDQISRTVNDIREITNSINKNNKYLDQIIAEVRRYALDQFENGNVSLDFKFDTDKAQVVLPIQLRQNLKGFLKEVINNSNKHSSATSFKMYFQLKNKILNCNLEDNGIGFDYQKKIKTSNGDGLRNFEKRVNRMKVTSYVFKTQPEKGTSVFLEIDLNRFVEDDYL